MKKFIKRFLFTIIFILLSIITIFLIYSLNYYKSDETAKEILKKENIKIEKMLFIMVVYCFM